MSPWQVGDLAVCVDAERRFYSPKFVDLEVGKSYRVRGIRVTRCGEVNLLMVGCNPEGLGWRAFRFRKVVQDKREACEPEFVTLLKRSKRRVDA